MSRTKAEMPNERLRIWRNRQHIDMADIGFNTYVINARAPGQGPENPWRSMNMVP